MACSPFDILKSEGDGVRWIEAAPDLDTAKARVQAIGSTSPGEYLIFGQLTGDKLVVKVAGRESSPHLSANISDNHVRTALNQFLDDAIEMANADFGNLQLFEPADRTLKIAVHHGFSQRFLNFFKSVNLNESCACGAVLIKRQRVVVNDVTRDSIFSDEKTLEILLAENVHAVQSMPLTSGSQFVGVLSVHYRKQGIPIERQTAISDTFLATAADLAGRLCGQLSNFSSK